MDEVTKDVSNKNKDFNNVLKTIWWGDVNIPLRPEGYARNRNKAIDCLNTAKRLFVIDGYAGWDPEF